MELRMTQKQFRRLLDLVYIGNWDVKHKAPLSVDENKCVGCKSCMKIGCPAISIVDGKAKIDNTLCTGCGVCAQLCKLDALQAAKEA